MTKGQLFVLLAIILLALLIALLAFTLLREDQAATPVPTLTRAVLPTATATQPVRTSTPIIVPPTWTSQPTNTPYPTNTPKPAPTSTSTPTASPTFAPTITFQPTAMVTPTLESLTDTLELENPGFEDVQSDNIPGWNWWSKDNFTPGGDYNPDTSYETPLFKLADDPTRIINGPTLQIDGEQHVKFMVYISQTVSVSPVKRISFQVSARAYTDVGAVMMAAGIVPSAGAFCQEAQWSDAIYHNQAQGVQTLKAPPVDVGPEGDITLCLYAEPQYAVISNAAFFDDVELITQE